MITKEKVVEILEQYAYRSAAAGRIVVYETNFEDIAEDVVKNYSIPDVVGQSELLAFKEWFNDLPDESDDRLYITDETISRFKANCG